jgi:O-antigen/teichoic acid export membrane protein
LANNLILARLLIPEAFGLMALTQVFITGLEMLSDVGVGPAIIQGAKGGDPRLLRTAWTVQVIRGGGLAVIAAGMAWPVSRLYNEPRLLGLLPVAALGMVLRGFTSTRLYTLNRDVQLKPLTILETGTQAFAVAVTIAAAWWLRSVWALMIGSLSGIAARVLTSHLALPGERDRFGWDREASRELGKVGRWVFISTATTFLVGYLDRLTLGRLLSLTELGIYTTASFLASAFPLIGRSVSGRVFFPMLSETIRTDPTRLYARLRKVRFVWTVPTCAILAVLALFGELVVRILYRGRFQEAGWMLRILAAGSIPAVINQATGVVWAALGEFRMITILMIIQAPLLFGCMLAGHALAGLRGVVTGIALVELMIYPIQAILAYRRKLWQPELDLPLFAVTAALVGLGWWLK